MKKFFSSRKWHTWVGIVLCLPMFIVGATAVLLSVDGLYKGKESEPMVNVSWLPGYSPAAIAKEYVQSRAEIRAYLPWSDSLVFYGNKFGLFCEQAGRLTPIATLEGTEIHSLARFEETLLAGTKNGLFSIETSSLKATLLLKKDCHQIQILGNGAIAVADNKMLYHSGDKGATWQPDKRFTAKVGEQLPSLNTEGLMAIPMHKLVMDLHTGKAFTGKAFEDIWIFILGVSTSLLTVTGIVIWLRKEIKKRNAIKKMVNKKA